MRLLLLDNYDSFTYNLVAAFAGCAQVEVVVRRNDAISVDDAAPFDALAFSPGPGLPDQAGIMMSLIERYAETKPMFGVCLGLQALALVCGGELYNLEQVCHGVSTMVHVQDASDPLFRKVPGQFAAGRYHSWALDPARLPANLRVTATDAEGVIMAVRHAAYPLFGVQFHPESIMTPLGPALIKNFIEHVS
ncbi:MAG: aminodeoxychorismate/anthranilate synthase component II [Saprospiraceae bacterium]|nr:aminodeoxychorismate/anthranilate synthase component II [Saprospiraceae bacterium]